MTTLNKSLEELKFEFSDINGILHDAFTLTGKSVSSIKNNSNIDAKKRRYNSINEINVMQTKFSEAENELLKKSSAQIVSAQPNTILDTYQNNLPYGVPPAGNQINNELYGVDENTWGQFSKDMGKIFKKIGKEQLNAMQSQNSHLKGSDIENMVYGTCGSLSEWPQINPKSAGLGKCSKLFEVFNNHYKKYSGKIDESKFYSDLISSLHTSEIFALSGGITGKRNTTAIPSFSNEVKVYNIDTSLWFPSDEEKRGKEAEYNGFVRTGNDSYGNFFNISGFPIRFEHYIDPAKKYTMTPTQRGNLTPDEYNNDNNAIKTQSKNNNGAYTAYTNDTRFIDNNNIVIVNDAVVKDGGKSYKINKKYCMLYQYEGSKTDVNKLEEINNPFGYTKYLYNSHDSSFKSLINAKDNINDRIITQRTNIIFQLFVIRLMFEQVYPITRAGLPNANIFQIHDMITNTGAGQYFFVAGGAGIFLNSKYKDNIDETRSKLLNKINESDAYTKYLTPESLIQFKRLLNLMTDTPGGGAPPADLGDIFYDTHIKADSNKNFIIGMTAFRNEYLSQTNPGGNNNNFLQFYDDLRTKAFSIRGAPYNAVRDSFSFATNPDNDITDVLHTHNFNQNDLDVDPTHNNRNGSVPVLVYRFIMRRMVAWYKRQYFSTAATNNNNAKLYRNDTAIALEDPATIELTKARTQGANHEILIEFKQAIPDINPIMVGGSRKSSQNNLIKSGGSKRKKIQKGGAVNTLFTGNGTPKLYANRKLMNFNAKQYEFAVKKYKELGFTADYNKVKLLFNKISQITYLPLFFDGYNDELNISCGGGAAESGGCGVVPPNNTQVPLSFSDVAQLFLFNSVNTTTTTLLIHFLKNIKACLNHFMTTDLKVVNDKLSSQITGSQSDKIEGSLRELVKEIDKVVNFLKYNTLNLQEQTVRLNNTDFSANPTHQFQNNEHYIKNLFLGANVFFSYDTVAANNAWQSVIMRFTTNDLGNDGAGTAQVNWQGDKFFEFLNRIVGCTENGNIFGNTLKFLTDSNNPVNAGLHEYITHIPANPIQNNLYLARIKPFIKDKPDGCFGGIPFVSLDPKTFSSLMRSFYLLLGLRLTVGIDIQTNERIEEETEYSTLKQDRKDAIRKNIQDILTISAFSTLAESLKSEATIAKANMIFNTIFEYLFNQSRRLIAQVNQAKQEINKASKVGNKKNPKKGLFVGGGPTSIYTFRQKSNSNNKNSIIKSQVNFIKITHQVSAEFEYMMNEILIQIKKEIERRGVKNELHFYYYIDTHFRNFKIYMNTYLLTIGDNNIPPEMAEKLQEYISYSPDKNKAVDSYKKLTQIPLIDPKYSDPVWWAKIERKFMDIQEIGLPSSDTVYRLFIITTTPPSKGKFRDLYIIDAFSLATLDDRRSQDTFWKISSTGYRTHVGVKKSVDSNGNKIYLNTNTAIKLTGVGSNPKLLFGIPKIKQNSTKAQMMTQSTRTNINKAIKGAIDEDIRDLIRGKYKYFDTKDNRYKTLIPLFLQANKNDLLKNIVETQKDKMFRGYEHKFSLGSNIDYRIYQLSDDYIKDLKKYRQWLYQIFIEQQMKLKTPPEIEKFDSIETSMISSFKGWLFSTNTTGKCTRIYNIYDYIVLQSTDAILNTNGNKQMSTFRNGADPYKPGRRNPAPIDFKTIRSPDPNLSNTFDLGAKMISGFISRESLIKLMLIY